MARMAKTLPHQKQFGVILNITRRIFSSELRQLNALDGKLKFAPVPKPRRPLTGRLRASSGWYVDETPSGRKPAAE